MIDGFEEELKTESAKSDLKKDEYEFTSSVRRESWDSIPRVNSWACICSKDLSFLQEWKSPLKLKLGEENIIAGLVESNVVVAMEKHKRPLRLRTTIETRLAVMS